MSSIRKTLTITDAQDRYLKANFLSLSKIAQKVIDYMVSKDRTTLSNTDLRIIKSEVLKD